MSLPQNSRNHPPILEVEGDPAFHLRLSDANRDADELLALVQENPYLVENGGYWANNITDQQTALNQVEFTADRIQRGVDVQYRMVEGLRDGSVPMFGTVTIYNISGTEAYMGYWQAANRQGRGYATRAVARLMTYAQTVLNLETIRLEIAVGNTSSQQLARRLEFEQIALRPYDLRFHNRVTNQEETYDMGVWETHL